MSKYIQPVVIIILGLAFLLSVRSCNSNKKIADSNLNDTVTYYNNLLGTQTASIKVIRLKESQLKHVILNKDKELTALTKKLSQVKNITQYTQVIKQDTIRVVYKDTIPCIFTKSGNIHNNWYSLRYKANHKGFTIDSLTIPNKVTVVTGFKRKWFLGEQLLVTNITNSNPYVIVKTMQSVEVAVPAPWYKKWYILVLAGAAGGILIAK